MRKSKAVDFLTHGSKILVNLTPYSWDERKEGWKMTRITIIVACAVFIFCFNPPLALSQPYYAPYLLLWHQSVENQAQIQELQRQLADVGIEIGNLRKDLTSIFELLQRLEEREISSQNTIKTFLEELSRMQKEIGEIRQKLVPEKE
jgi:peptidoglycan hydrolase CwlO-like protein